MYLKLGKRIFDIVFAILALLILLIPFLFIIILIKFDSPGEVFFRQKRVGKDSVPFRIFKFRSMYVEAPHNSATNSLEHADQHITRVGKFMRAYSIDELPQFLNVLAGDMSIIGPRPVICQEEELIGLRHKNGADRVLPGLTGLAQVHGRDHVPIRKKAEYDGIYAASVSLSTDMKIIIRTVWYVLLHVGVHEGKHEDDAEDLNNINHV